MNRIHGVGIIGSPVRTSWSIVTIAVIASVLGTPSHAANGTWNVDAAGNWVDTANWLDAVVPGTSGTTFTNTDTATFTTTLTSNRTVTLDANRNVKDILFSNDSGFGYTLSSGTLRLTNGGSIESAPANGAHVATVASAVVLASAGTASFVSNATSSSSLLSITGPVSGGSVVRLAGTNTGSNSVTGAISGAMLIRKDGEGYWSVSNATSTGGITVNSGTLDFKASLNGRGNVSVAGGTLLASTGTISTANQSVSVNGGRVEIDGAFGLGAATNSFTLSSGTFKTTGDFTAGAASGVNLNGGSLDVGGQLSIRNTNATIASEVIVRGGTTSFIAPDWNSRSYTITSGSNVSLGAVVLGSSTARYPGIAFNIGNGGVLADAMFASSIFGWDLSNGEPTIGVTFNHSNANYAFSTLLTGTFFSNSNALLLSGSGGVRQNGPGKTTLTGSNSFVGNVTVSTGTLAIGHANALGSTSNQLFVNGGVFDLHGYDLSIGALSGSSSGVIMSSTAGGVALTVNQSSTGTYAGRIMDGLGTLALVKSGNGRLTLTGSNSFSGATTVSGGTLTISHNLALQNSRINTDDNGSLGLDSGITTPTFGGLSGSTALATKLTGFANVTALTLNPLSGSVTYSGIIADGTGPLAVTKSGAGEQIVSGVNTYTGATLVSAGRLQVSSGNINSSSAVTINGPSAELKYNSATALTSPITFSQGMLSGTGTINSAVTAVGLAATLSPGNSPGIMPFGTSQAWESFTYLWETNNFLGTTAGTDFDQITITGSLALTGSAGSYLLDITSLTAGNIAGDVGNFSDMSRSWTILTTTGGISGFDAAHWTISTANFAASPTATGLWSISNVGNDVVLNYVIAVPEPTSLTLAGLGAVLAGWAARRRRSLAERR